MLMTGKILWTRLNILRGGTDLKSVKIGKKSNRAILEILRFKEWVWSRGPCTS